MITAYVLLNTEIHAENRVLKALQKIYGIEEAHRLWGVYDIIGSIKVESIEKLQQLIVERIGQIGKINSKLTMIAAEGPPLALEERVFFGHEHMEDELNL